MNNSWLQSTSANRLNQSYVKGFVDVSGNVIVRNGSVNIKTGKLFIPQGDISMNGNIICSGSISLGTTTGSGYQMTVNGNTRVKNSLLVDNDASVMSSLGVGKASNDTYPLDVNGATRLSSTLSVGGASTFASIADVTGTSIFTGSVGIGAPSDPDYALYAGGQVFATARVSLNQSLTVGPDINFDDELYGSTVFVKAPISSTAPNDVIMNVPNNLYVSTDKTNQSKTNKLEIDTKNHVIKPYVEIDGSVVTDVANGWDLGATGANSFNRVYGRTLEVSKNVGIGKSSDAGYAMDVSGATRLSSSLAVGGAATIGSITNVTGTSKFTGAVGIGKTADEMIALDISGTTIVSGNTYIAQSLVVGNTAPSTATLHVSAPTSTATNTVILDAPNVLYKAASSSNPANTNFLEIDTKTRSILPYAKDSSNTLLNTTETGWNLGGTGANRFSKIYGRDLEISTNTIKIEDESGNQISMSFDATSGAVNYTVTTISGEVFVIKGVQTQKISSSGSGTIDPALLEFTGLSFGDMFAVADAYNLANAFTYNLGTTTYTGDGSTFTTSAGAQSLNSFVTGTNLTTLLALVPTGTSVVIKVGATDGRSAYLEGIDVGGSLVSLANKIISVKKTNSATTWTLWNSDGYQNVAGNFLHYIELKNINMISGTYFIPKVPGTMTYNISDTQYMETADLTAGNGDIYLYVNRGPGKNWTKVRVALPQAGTIQTQHMADSAITTTKLADASVTGAKLADGSISGLKITDNSLISSKIADANITTAKLADGAVTGAKLAGGVINNANLFADGIITGAKLASGAIIESAIGTESVTETKIGVGAVTTAKLADNSVTVDKLADGSINQYKMTVDSILNEHIVGGAISTDKITDSAITTEKIANGAITASKLATGAITGSLLDASSVTMAKIASGAVSTDKMAVLAVTTAKIANSAVTDTKLADGSVTSAKLATDSVSETKILDNSITSAKITDYAVTADKIGGSAITSGKIADGSILESKLGSSAVTTDKLASLSVTSEKLADFSVTEFKIADGSITIGKLASSALTAGPMGATGPAGVDGIAGPTGPAGVDGIAGATGAIGPTGPAGGASSGPTDTVTTKTLTVTDSTTMADTIISGTVANDGFGNGALLSKDGKVIIVRNKVTSGTCTIYIYRLNTSTKEWVRETTKSGYQYLHLSGDGNTIITSNGTANTRTYKYSAGAWDAGTMVTTIFGKHIVSDFSASKVVYCNNSNPPMKVMTTATSAVVPLGVAANNPTNFFNILYYNNINSTLCSCQMSNDGNTLVASSQACSISKTYPSGVYTETFNTSTWTGLVRIYKNTGSEWSTYDISGSNVGHQVAINADGTILATLAGVLGSEYGMDSVGRQIFIYNYNSTNGTWTKTYTISKDAIQKAYGFGKCLKFNNIGDTLVVGCYTNDISTGSTFDFRYLDKIGYSIEAHVYKLVGSVWDKYTTLLSNISQNNINLVASNFSETVSIDASGNTITISEDNYYTARDSMNGRFHIYNLNRSMTNLSGGLNVTNDIYTRRNIISNGVIMSDKVYTNSCSVGDSLSIGAPPSYNTMFAAVDGQQLYALYVRQSQITRIPSSYPYHYHMYTTKVRIDGGIYLHTQESFGVSNTPSSQFLNDGSIIHKILTNNSITTKTITCTNEINAGTVISNGVMPILYSDFGLSSSNFKIGLGTTQKPLMYLSTTTYSAPWSYTEYLNMVSTISDDGNTMVLPNGFYSEFYKRINNSWKLVKQISASNNFYGNSLSRNGLVFARNISSSIDIITKTGTDWSTYTTTSLTPSSPYTIGETKYIALNDDGSKLLAFHYKSTTDYKIFIYNTSTSAALITINAYAKGIELFSSNTSNTAHIAFSNDGTTVAVGNAKSTNALGAKIFVWDINYSDSTFAETTIVPTHPTTPGGTNEFPGRPTTVNYNGTVLAYTAGTGTTSRVVICRRADKSSAWTTEKTVFGSDILPGVASRPALVGTPYGKTHLSPSGTALFITMNDGSATTGAYYAVSRYVNGVWSDFNVITSSSTATDLFGYSIKTDYNGDIVLVTRDSLKSVLTYTTFPITSTTPLNLLSNSIVLSTGTTETGRVFISSDGDVGIGSAAVSGTKLSVTGTITATSSITANSDDRLKEDEELIVNATDTIMKLRPEKYSKKPTFDSTDKTTWQKESGLIAQEIWYATPELRHLVTLGQDISGVTVEYEPDTTIDSYPPTDVSNNKVYGELISQPTERISVDICGNITPYIEPIKVTIPGKSITKPRYVPIDPANIVDYQLPLASDANIQQDPDYKALGWGDTPASVNYIGLIPYLVKSIQELKTEINGQRSEINAQHTEIEQQKTYIQTLESRLNK